MPFKFNPFSGNFDQTGSGGGGSSYIDGEVQNFSALPETVGTPAVDSAYLVREAEGTWLLNRKPAGIYIRTANTGTRASDWTHASAFPDVFNDANLVVYSNGDSSKNLAFNVGGITTGTTRTITVPDKNITLDDAGDSRTPTAHAASHAAAGSDPVSPQSIGAQSVFVTENLGTITADVNLTAARAKIYTVTVNTFDTPTPSVRLPSTDIVAGDVVQIRFTSNTGRTMPVKNGNGSFLGNNLSNGQQATFIAASTSSTSWSESPNNRFAVGSSSGIPIITGSGGYIGAGSFGVNAGEFAEGNHTHTQLHDKSHTMTDATSHTAGNHKVFYSDGSGNVQELALGNSGEVLTSNGASAAPSFAAASGGVTGAAASASDVLGVSGSDITGVDAGSDKIVFWDDSASELTYLATVGPTFDGTTLRWPVELVVACSDETSDLTTGTAKVTFRAPYAFLLTGVRASVNTAPTGSTLIIDINNGANSALSTKLSIDASEKTSTTAASAAVIDTTYDDISDDAEITIDIDQIGSTIAGKGLKVTLIGTRA